MQRKTLIRLMFVVLPLLVLSAATGCTRKIIADNVRTSLASFVTGVASSAVDASLSGD